MRFKAKRTLVIALLVLMLLAHFYMVYQGDDDDDDNELLHSPKNSKFGQNEDSLPKTTTVIALRKFDESDLNSMLFKSFEQSKLYMSTSKNISHPSKIVIQYSNFSRRMPNFIDEGDREVFMQSERNLDNLKAQTYEQLRGVIEIIPNATFQMDYECGFRSKSDFFKIPRKPNYSFEILVPLVIPMGFLFQHFFDGTFPKIIQALEYVKLPDVKILIEEPNHKNVYMILKKLGITRDRIVWHQRSDTSTVYHANYMLITCVTPPLHPTLWTEMRKVLGVNKILDIPLHKSNIIYLTRAGASNGGRNALNEEEVTKYLRERYRDRFIIFRGKYNLDEAISVFGRAGIIIGTHGGAFYNMNYAPINTTVIEFVPVLKSGRDIPSLPHAIFWAMSDLLGQAYWRVPCESANRQHDMTIDMHKLEKILNQVENEVH